MIDHMMIYVVIAGGYTPIAVLTLSDDVGAIVLTGIWIIAGLGILKKSLWMNAPSWFSTLLYILMGWVSVFIIPIIWRETTPFFSYGIIIGGLFYTIGAVVYALKKPNILQKSVGFHGLWHIFVLGGALTHLLSHLYYYTNFFS
jgi:hemolysin III